jgi:hypothetical protein
MASVADPDPNPDPPDPHVFVTLFDFLSLKNEINVASKSNEQKKLRQKKTSFFPGILNINDKNSRIRIC